MDEIQEKNTLSTMTEEVLPHTETTISEEVSVVSDGELRAKETPWYKKNMKTIIAVSTALLILIGAGFYAYATYYKNGGTVAVVNGKHIYQTELTESITLIEQGAKTQGVDLTQESVKTEIRTQALDVLVNNALLITSAQKAGVIVTNDDIQGKYDELVKELGTQEELTKRMVEIGLSEQKLRDNIRERIIADNFIKQKTDIENLSVSAEEVTKFVESLGTDAKIPPLEEIRPQIEAQILSQKQQQLVADLIEKLRTDAKIDIK